MKNLIKKFLPFLLFLALGVGGITAYAANFPTSLNNFQNGDIIEASDWNAIELTIGETSTTSKNTMFGRWADLYSTTTMSQLTTLLNITSFISSSSTLQNFTFTNATGTSATTTNFFSTNLFGTTGNIGTLTLTNALTVANGGTGASSYTTGSIPFSNGTILTQDNTHLFWTSSTNRLTATNFVSTNSTSTNATTTTLAVSNVTSCSGANALQTNSSGGVTCGAIASSVSVAPIGSDGNDGDVTVSTTITLTRDMYYDTLTVSSGGTINTGGYKVFCKTACNVNSGGIVQNNGGNGGNGNNTGGCSQTSGGTAGAAAPGITVVPGRAGAAGGISICSSGADTGGTGGAGIASTYSLVDWRGEQGGLGGAGNGASGQPGAAGATSTSATVLPRNTITAFNLVFQVSYSATSTIQNYGMSGGASGGGGGGSTSSCGASGGGGGASGASGGMVWIAAPTITNAGTIQALGGNGGNGGNGAGCSPQSGVGGGGAAGNGGVLMLIASTHTNTGTESVAAGTPGTKGVTGNSTGATNGNTGHVGVIFTLKN